MRLRQDAGLAAGAVLSAADLLDDAHLADRGCFPPVEQPEVGTHRYPASPLHGLAPLTATRRPAPRLGEHHRLVLGDLLGYSASRIARLEEEGVIGTEPIS